MYAYVGVLTRKYAYERENMHFHENIRIKTQNYKHKHEKPCKYVGIYAYGCEYTHTHAKIRIYTGYAYITHIANKWVMEVNIRVGARIQANIRAYTQKFAIISKNGSINTRNHENICVFTRNNAQLPVRTRKYANAGEYVYKHAKIY